MFRINLNVGSPQSCAAYTVAGVVEHAASLEVEGQRPLFQMNSLTPHFSRHLNCSGNIPSEINGILNNRNSVGLRSKRVHPIFLVESIPRSRASLEFDALRAANVT